jgi:hypothetical protein
MTVEIPRQTGHLFRLNDGKDLAEDGGTMNLYKMQNIVTEGNMKEKGAQPRFFRLTT